MIDGVEALRGLYAEPKGRSLKKQLDRLDAHCMRFISLSPFVVVATTGADGLAHFAGAARAPKLALEVAVEEAYLHCAKALMRSKLWASESRNERSVLPTMGQMLNDQTGTAGPAETQEQMVARYLPAL